MPDASVSGRNLADESKADAAETYRRLRSKYQSLGRQEDGHSHIRNLQAEGLCERRNQRMEEFLLILNEGMRRFIPSGYPVVYGAEVFSTAFYETGCQLEGCASDESCSFNPTCAHGLCVPDSDGCFEQSHCNPPCEYCDCSVGI